MLMENLPIPQDLQAEFESMATLVYGEEDASRALIEAVELWLANKRERQIESESIANNQKFEEIKTELLQQPSEKWFVIAHGKLQAFGNSIEEVGKVALTTAHHRIVMQVGEIQLEPITVELGWQSSFVSFDGNLEIIP